ncbi:signal peptidase II [Thermobrachium celere]|uniref:Lipoprotein signal peptidase n=1 Tax=Thermobrachium celere DSM 8682 TaxID=941824 RepID=R7RP84_9CLOT|nr:signal peptidase II [Thermobrachium celere]CDF57874.1 Lipoprotein signal peptidase [Thermobrachium celere DSM 8682]
MEFVIISLLVLIDQITKYIAKNYLIIRQPINILEGFLNLVYVENRGAAFGIFRDKKIILIGFTSLVIVGLIYYLYKNKGKDKIIDICLILVIAGAIGNLIDRVFLSYVVDFIHFYIRDVFDWPVFNFADIYVSIGAVLLSIKLIFFDK